MMAVGAWPTVRSPARLGACATFDGHLSRLGRHCLLFHDRMWRSHPGIDVVVDGLETFELASTSRFTTTWPSRRG